LAAEENAANEKKEMSCVGLATLIRRIIRTVVLACGPDDPARSIARPFYQLQPSIVRQTIQHGFFRGLVALQVGTVRLASKSPHNGIKVVETGTRHSYSIQIMSATRARASG
jgi:hypothetical protein